MHNNNKTEVIIWHGIAESNQRFLTKSMWGIKREANRPATILKYIYWLFGYKYQLHNLVIMASNLNWGIRNPKEIKVIVRVS